MMLPVLEAILGEFGRRPPGATGSVVTPKMESRTIPLRELPTPSGGFIR